MSESHLLAGDLPLVDPPEDLCCGGLAKKDGTTLLANRAVTGALAGGAGVAQDRTRCMLRAGPVAGLDMVGRGLLILLILARCHPQSTVAMYSLGVTIWSIGCSAKTLVGHPVKVALAFDLTYRGMLCGLDEVAANHCCSWLWPNP